MGARRGAALFAGLGAGTLLFLMLSGASAGTPGLTTRESVVSGTLDGGADGESTRSSISADGRFVAFASAATDLVPGLDLPPETTITQVYRRDRETAEVELVSVDANGLPFTGGATRPSISGDGARVAFEGLTAKLEPAPDGSVSVGHLVFISNADGGDDVFIAAPDATDAVNLTNAPGVVHTDPVLSPDGTRVAFARGDTADGRFNVYVMDADGLSAPVLLTDATDTGTASYRHPDWSPDGGRLVLSGSGLEPATEGGPTDAILIVNADGSELERLTGVSEFETPDAGHADPAWAPDGRTVAFTELRSVGTASERRVLALFDLANGTEEVVFFSSDSSDPVPTNPRQPRWSPTEPDVLVLTAVPEEPVIGAIPAVAPASVDEASEDDQVFRVTLVEVSGSFDGEAQQLTENGGFDPAWRRDGQRVVFASLRPDDTLADLFEIAADADAGLEDQLVRLTTNPVGAGGRSEEPHVGPTFISTETRLRITATLGAAAGQPAPAGVVQVRLCPPGQVVDGECGPLSGQRIGPPVELTETVDGDATATSIPTSEAVPPVGFDEPGAWCGGFEYRGDARYQALQHGVGEELCVEVTHAVADGTLEMDVGAWEGEGELTATLTLVGATVRPFGLVTFFLCGPGETDAAGCPEGGVQVGPPTLLSGGFTTATARPDLDPDDPLEPDAAGRYCWRAEYAGDWRHQPQIVYDNALSCFTFDSDFGDEGFELPPHPVLALVATPTGNVLSPATSEVEVTLTFDEARGEPDVASQTVSVFLCSATTDRFGCREGGTPVAEGLDISTGSAQVGGIELVGEGPHCYRAEYSEDGSVSMRHTDARTGCVSVAAPFVPDVARSEVYVRDIPAGTTTTVSVSPVGGPADGDSSMASISAEGNHVAFSSWATNLSPTDLADYPEGSHVFLRDLAAATTELVSVYLACDEPPCSPGDNIQPSVSDSGEHVAFTSAFSDALDAVNPVTGEPHLGTSAHEVFVRDMAAGVTELVSIDDAGNPPAPPPGVASEQGSAQPSISGDGTRIAFTSDADTLVEGDTNEAADVFVRDRAAATTMRVSVGSLAEQGDLPSFEPAMSHDGRTVAFASAAEALVPGVTNNALCVDVVGPGTPAPDPVPCLNADVYVHDVVTGRTGRVSVDSDDAETELGKDSRRPSISANGRFVAFDSDSEQLVDGDDNEKRDVFVRDRTPVLVLAPDPVDFGGQLVGTASAPAVVTGVNAGSGPLEITALGLTGDVADFELVSGGDSCTNAVLFVGDPPCTIEVVFTPTVPGARQALLNVESTAPGSPHSVTLLGTGTEALAEVTPDPLDFGEVQVFTSGGPLMATLQSVGTAPVTVTSVAVAGPDADHFTIVAADDACTGATVPPKSACGVAVTFSPDRAGPHTAALVFTDDAAGSPRSVGLVGVGAPSGLAFDLTPDPVEFGEVPVGTPSTPGVATGLSLGDLPVPIGDVTITGPHAADFAIVAANETCQGATLAPDESCQVPVVFTPSAAGPRQAVLEVAVADGARTAGLIGVGVGRLLALEPDPLDFGVVVEGETSEALAATATNAGSAPVAITAVVVEQDDEDGEPLAAPEFRVVEGGDGCTGVTLAAGASCTITLELEAQAPGAKAGALEVASDADGAPHRIDLVGLSPHLRPDPPLARPGFVTFVAGADFPPEETLLLQWEPGIGAALVVTDEEGAFTTPMLVMRRDRIGPREIIATAPDGDYQVVAEFLVVPGSAQPSDFVTRR